MSNFDIMLLARVSHANACIASLNACLYGMVAENQAREQRGEAPAYSEKAFLEVSDNMNEHANALMHIGRG